MLCPWQSETGGCMNAEGVCNNDCAKSNWYQTDHKCICGASGADWITKDQCRSCTVLPAEEVATTDACPWQSETGGCMNAEGVCNKDCAKSNWYQTDHKCICGASGA